MSANEFFRLWEALGTGGCFVPETLARKASGLQIAFIKSFT
jgi:hypothetical protein